MESTARNITFLEGPTLVERVRAEMEDKGLGIEEMARLIGYSRPTLCLYLSGKYESNPAKLEAGILAYFERQAQGAAEGPAGGAKPVKPWGGVFFETNDAKKVIGVCRSSQMYNTIGLIVGPSGYGKSYALKTYAKLPKVVYIECEVTMSGRDLLRNIEQNLGIPRSYAGNGERADRIRDFLKANPGYLLIFDEVDKLISRNSYSKLEILRGLHDKSEDRDHLDSYPFGMILCGEPGLGAWIESHIPRLSTRDEFFCELKGLLASEVERMLQDRSLEKDAMGELIQRACGGRHGCFRMLSRTLNNVFRRLENHPEQKITLKLIKEASSMMAV